MIHTPGRVFPVTMVMRRCSNHNLNERVLETIAMNPSALLTNHPFWGLLTLAALVWYSTITVYVGIRGVFDIQHMLRTLKDNHERTGPEKSDARNEAEKKS